MSIVGYATLSIIPSLRGMDAKMRSELGRLGGDLEGTARKAGARVGKGVGESAGKSLNDTLVAAGGVAVARRVGQFFQDSIDKSLEFETAFSGVRKTVTASDAEFGLLEGQLRDLAPELATTATNLAGIAEIGGQLGVAAGDIDEFAETVTKLDVATELNAEEAATNLGKFRSIMGETVPQMENMGSAMAQLADESASSERPMLDFALRTAGAGKIAGLTSAEVLGIGAAMTSVTPDVEAAATATQKVMSTMTQAVASGNESLVTFAQTAGLSRKEFAAMFEENPAEAFTLFVEGLGASGTKAFDILGTLELQDQRLIRSFLSLAGAGDTLRTAIDSGTDAYEKNTRLQDELDRALGTNAAKLQQAAARWNDLKITIGGTAANVITPVIGEISRLNPAIVGIGVGFAGVAASAVAFVRVKTLVGDALDTLRQMGPVAGKAASAIKLLGKGAEIAVAVGVLQVVWNKIDDVMDKIRGTEETVTTGLKQGLLDLSTEARSVSEVLDVLNEAGLDTSVVMGKITASIPDNGVKLKAFRQEFEALDQGLTQLVASAGAPAAQNAFDQILKVADITPGEGARVFDDFTKAMQEASIAEQAADVRAQGLAGSVGSVGTAMNGLAPEVDTASDALAGFAGMTVDEFEQWRTSTIPAINGVDDVLGEMSSTATSALEAIPGARKRLADALEDLGDGTKRSKDEMKGLRDRVKDARGELSELKDQSKITADEILEQFKRQAEATVDYGENFKELVDRGLPDDLRKDIQDMGLEGAGFVEALANANDTEFRKIIAQWNKGKEAAEGYANYLGVITEKPWELIVDIKWNPTKIKNFEATGTVSIRGDFAEPRAGGGPLLPGHSYIVGEERPELLTMGSTERGYMSPSVPAGNTFTGPISVAINADPDPERTYQHFKRRLNEDVERLSLTGGN